MPHRSFFSPPPRRSAKRTDQGPPHILDLIIDQPACVAEHFDLAMGLQAALTVSLIESGLEVVPALETQADPLGLPQLLYAERPRSVQELWAEVLERNFDAHFVLQLQVMVSGAGVGIDARLSRRQGEDTSSDGNKPTLTVRMLRECGEMCLDELIEWTVSEILSASGASSTEPPSILDLIGADDEACLALLLPSIGASIRHEMGEGGTPVHRELARAERGYAARDAATSAARELLN